MHIIPVGLAEFQRGRAADDAGVVHQDVQPAQPGHDLADHRVQVGHGRCTQVAADLVITPAELRHSLAGLRALAAIQPCDVRAGLGQPQRHRLPQPRAAPVTSATRPSRRKRSRIIVRPPVRISKSANRQISKSANRQTNGIAGHPLTHSPARLNVPTPSASAPCGPPRPAPDRRLRPARAARQP